MPGKRVTARFYRTSAGAQPVREWLLSLGASDRKVIGADIYRVELRWPEVSMPLVRKLQGQTRLWEIRSDLSGKRIARVLFTIKDTEMYLLHGFIKKSQATPRSDLALADRRRKEIEA